MLDLGLHSNWNAEILRNYQIEREYAGRIPQRDHLTGRFYLYPEANDQDDQDALIGFSFRFLKRTEDI